MDEAITLADAIPIFWTFAMFVFCALWWAYVNTISLSSFEFCKGCQAPKRKICACGVCGHYEKPSE